MRAWQFSRPKGPGFGISRSYYLSVLCATNPLPSIVQLIAPKGGPGVVAGFGVPLSTGDKELLKRSMERGAYALASLDRKTVLRMLLLSKEEAGFDASPLLNSALAADLPAETRLRIQSTWNLAQFTFESHDPTVYPALRFLLDLVTRLAELVDGVVADPICQRYLLPPQVRHQDPIDPRIDARDHIALGWLDRPDGGYAFTRGLQKFTQPEFEMANLGQRDRPLAERFLLVLAQSVLLGDLARSGERFGAGDAAFEARDGGFDKRLWEGIPVFELLPPTSLSATEALARWRDSLP